MPRSPVPDRALFPPATLAVDRLGVWSVVFFVASAVAPLTVVAGVISTGWAVTGITGFPLAFLAVAAVLSVFCVGYVAVARRIRNAGAFYTYVACGLGRPVGVGASFVALLAYNCLQIATFGAFGPSAAALLEDALGVPIAWWVPALAMWALVAVLGVLRVDLNGKVLAVAVLAEIALVVLLDLVDLAHPHGGRISTETLSPQSLSGPGLGVALAIAITGFVGFECAAVFSEESRTHSRTVPAATYIALGLMACLYAGSAWAMSSALGADNLQQAAIEHGPDLPFVVASGHLGGQTVVDLGHLLFLTSLLAAALSYHNTVARYLFALGRERVLPAALGRTQARNNSPRTASLTQSAVSLVVVLIYAVLGIDPLVRLFFWGGTTGAFGVLLLVASTSFAVMGYFRRTPDHGESRWRTTVAPAAACCGLMIMIGLIVLHYDQLLGVSPDSPLRWILPTAYPVLAVLGILWAGVLHRYRRAVYQVIGLGASPPSAGLRAPALSGKR
ncbi:MAG: hypothetical protein QG608_1145 [Actinomycetota bacterium]|nr:hypothetical protein [Actinomycetota bacterium]